MSLFGRFWFWVPILLLESEYASGSECGTVLDISGFWICLWFWIFQDSEDNFCASFSINFMPWQSSKYARVTWICLNIPEYTINLPEYLLFYNSPFPYLFYNPFSTWTRGYLFERLQETRGYSLKEQEAVFLKRHSLNFSISWKYFICFFSFN